MLYIEIKLLFISVIVDKMQLENWKSNIIWQKKIPLLVHSDLKENKVKLKIKYLFL